MACVLLFGVVLLYLICWATLRLCLCWILCFVCGLGFDFVCLFCVIYYLGLRSVVLLNVISVGFVLFNFDLLLFAGFVCLLFACMPGVLCFDLALCLMLFVCLVFVLIAFKLVDLRIIVH